MPDLSNSTRRQLPEFIREAAQDSSIPEPVFGILNGKAKALLGSGKPWIYCDHSYFRRGWESGNFRAIRDGLHLTTLIDRPTDRFKRWGIDIKPWRKLGSTVVVIPPSEQQIEMYGCDGWLYERLAGLNTDRKVIVKTDKSKPLEPVLRDAWCVITYASVAGVEAALAGVPVFSTPNCPSWPVNAGEDIESPTWPDNRAEWAAGLTYASWNIKELGNVRWHDYNYSMRCE